MRGLTAARDLRPADLQASVGRILDRRLQRASGRPLAVALSGGGDSLALTLAAAAWAGQAGRRLLVLSVDHRLRPESLAWTAACAATATRVGADFRALAWTDEKPRTGLPAAARAARHRLLADAAREASASVILMGHTADDVLEANLMRQAGSTTPAPREWSPSPAWPDGRGIFLLRPMLDLRRSTIRDWLRTQGETWIDDPANVDLAYARPRARRALTGGGGAPAHEFVALPAALAQACEADAEGGLVIARAALQAASPDLARRFVGAACLCAGGGARPPARVRVERLAARLSGGDAFVSGLAGARVTARGTVVRFAREPGEAARGGLAPLRMAIGETAVWDGRFAVSADRAVEVRAGRRAQPTALAVDGGSAAVRLTPLMLERLQAACGLVEREPV